MVLAKDMRLPSAAFINGAYQSGGGDHMKIVNPATGDHLTTIAMTNSDTADYAVSKAREALIMASGHVAILLNARTF